MQRVSGAEPQYLRIAHKRKGTYVIAVDVQQEDDGQYSYVEYFFDHLPSLEEVRAAINSYYNSITDEAILSGFTYEGVPVWLSGENQLNFKAAFDLAIQTDGENLPVKFKFGTEMEPVYKTFTSVEQLKDFYVSALTYIQECIEAGWEKKDAIDLNSYRP